jgi:glutamate racemase
MDSNGPIGIFDSGIGGLTVAKAIKEHCPNESIIYFGDTAHFPYGDKAPYSIRHYSHTIAEYLVEQGCKAIVIACNTASALSHKILEKKWEKRDIPVFDVVQPVAEHVSKSSYKKVGVIATKATVKSRIYPKSIHEHGFENKVTSLATPLLAPMIEEGFFNNNISNTIIDAYLSKSNMANINAIILGCTHYPIIQKEVAAYYKKKGKKVDIFNSAELVAKSVQKSLSDRGMNLTEPIKTQDHFYVSDLTESFQKSTSIFFGSEIKLEKMDIWRV